MTKGRNTSYWGVFSGGKIFVVVVLFAIITPVVSRVVGAVLAQADGRLMLLSATTKADVVRPAALNQSETKVANEPSEQWQTVRMRVTGYCACRRCCGKFADGITACGHKIRRGDAFVAADRRYSFGTEMIVAGYNDGKPIKVLDRGGAIRGNKLDLFFHSHKEAQKWGVQYIDVEVKQAH